MLFNAALEMWMRQPKLLMWRLPKNIINMSSWTTCIGRRTRGRPAYTWETALERYCIWKDFDNWIVEAFEYGHWMRCKEDFVFFTLYTSWSGKILHFICLRPKGAAFGPASFDLTWLDMSSWAIGRTSRVMPTGGHIWCRNSSHFAPAHEQNDPTGIGNYKVLLGSCFHRCPSRAACGHTGPISLTYMGTENFIRVFDMCKLRFSSCNCGWTAFPFGTGEVQAWTVVLSITW